MTFDATSEIVDRSTLQRWADCPFQGYAAEHKLVETQTEATATGIESHEAIATAVAAVAAGTAQSVSEVVDLLVAEAIKTRPDVQPTVVESIRYAAWGIARVLLYQENGEPRHPNDIIRFDRGQDDRSGQIAYELDVDKDVITATCRLDLLLATPAPTMLSIVDFKTGWGEVSANDIFASFQLGCFQPGLVMLVYPEVNTVSVQAYNTKFNDLTEPVIFRRDRHLAAMIERIRAACRVRAAYVKRDVIDDVPTWPFPKKCASCPAARICPRIRTVISAEPAAGQSIQDTHAELLSQFIAVNAARDQLYDLLTAYTDKHGDIRLPSGQAFGRNKPPSKRRPTADLYECNNEPTKETVNATVERNPAPTGEPAKPAVRIGRKRVQGAGAEPGPAPTQADASGASAPSGGQADPGLFGAGARGSERG